MVEAVVVFADIPEALSNTLEILDKVEIYSLDHDPIMPFFPIPESFGTEEEWRKKFSEDDLYREFTTDENGENPLPADVADKKIAKLGGYDKIYRIKFEADYLALLAYKGAKARYGDPLPQEVEERVKFELHIMKTMIAKLTYPPSPREGLGVGCRGWLLGSYLLRLKNVSSSSFTS